jgi:transposase
MDMRETITLDTRAQRRVYVLNHVLTGGITTAEAARILELSERQVRRLLKRYRADGADGLVHGNHDRAPAHRTPDAVRARLVELATTTYAGVNHAHLAELLAEREALVVPERSLRRILAEAAVRPVRTRRPARHRSRRERMAREGQMVQTDGSRHRWFGPELPFATLVGVVDDATGVITGATFRAAEDAAGYFTAFGQMAAAYGLPGAVYSDRHGIFIAAPNRAPTIAEQLTGRRTLTQVGRALEEAAIAWIGAHSAQGKGRVERTWGTLQDRLVVELRLETITTIEDANAFLPTFIVRYNTRFAVPAANPELAWRPWPADLSAEAVFCFHYPRRVARDATMSWGGVDLALPPRPDGRSWAGRTVTLQERLDGSLWISHEGRALPLQPAPPRPSQLRVHHVSRAAEGTPDREYPEPRPSPPPTPSTPPWRPAPHHPWRQYADRSR